MGKINVEVGLCVKFPIFLEFWLQPDIWINGTGFELCGKTVVGSGSLFCRRVSLMGIKSSGELLDALACINFVPFWDDGVQCHNTEDFGKKNVGQATLYSKNGLYKKWLTCY